MSYFFMLLSAVDLLKKEDVPDQDEEVFDARSEPAAQPAAHPSIAQPSIQPAQLPPSVQEERFRQYLFGHGHIVAFFEELHATAEEERNELRNSFDELPPL